MDIKMFTFLRELIVTEDGWVSTGHLGIAYAI